MYLFIYTAIAHARPCGNKLCILIRTLRTSHAYANVCRNILLRSKDEGGDVRSCAVVEYASSRELDLHVNSRVSRPWLHYATFAFSWRKSHIYTPDGRNGQNLERSPFSERSLARERDSIRCTERARNVATRQVYVTGGERKKGAERNDRHVGRGARKLAEVGHDSRRPPCRRSERYSGANAVINISLAASWRMQ